jgi:hypothetical protein
MQSLNPMNENKTENKASATAEVAQIPRVKFDGETDAYWNDNTLISISDFREQGETELRKHYFERCELANDEARYFCAVNGDTFGLICRNSDSSCIAEIETALGYACNGYRYVTFALKSRTPSAIRAWTSKWSKRTAPDAHVSMFDASVRGSAPVN